MTATEACGVGAPYLPLRKAIGWIGSLLPALLIAGDGAFSSAPLLDPRATPTTRPCATSSSARYACSVAAPVTCRPIGPSGFGTS